MQIISKFKDYYDCMQKFASYEDRPFTRNIVNRIIPDALKVDSFTIGFCGKLYRGKTIRYRPDLRKKEIFSKKVYSTEEYASTYNIINLDRETKRRLDVYFAPIEDSTFFLLYNCPIFIAKPTYDGKRNINLCIHTLNKPDQQKKRYMYDTFYNEFKVDTLEDMEFHKVFGPELAYMEIESYIRGTLFKENKGVPIMSNEDKINLSGHSKNSFKGK